MEEIMLKRTFTILLFVAGITIIGLGAFNVAKAVDCNNFSIDLQSVVRDHGDVFKYNYIVDSNVMDIGKISLLNFGIDGSLILDPALNPNISIHLPGEGSHADAWLEGVPQLQTLTIPAQSYTESDPLIIYISGTGGNVGTVAAHTKAGNKIETCFIEGPVIGLPVDVSIPSSKVVNLLGKDFCIDLDPRTGCPEPNPIVYVCGTDKTKVENQLPIDANFVLGSSAASGDIDGPTTPTIVHGEGSDPRCPVSKVAHNPCQWDCIGGTCYGAYCY
jgi:hypothetical protein